MGVQYRDFVCVHQELIDIFISKAGLFDAGSGIGSVLSIIAGKESYLLDPVPPRL